MSEKFYSKEQIEDLAKNSVNTASPGSFGTIAAREASEIINTFDDVSFNEQKSMASKSVNVKIGQIFEHDSKLYIKTPYNTIVDAQLYINVLQEQLIKIGNLTFFELFKLAIKRLFKRG